MEPLAFIGALLVVIILELFFLGSKLGKIKDSVEFELGEIRDCVQRIENDVDLIKINMEMEKEGPLL